MCAIRSSHRPRKRFGQNFLTDAMIISEIIHAIAPQADDCLVEIGPGLGALTQPLLEIVNKMTVVELDRDLAAKLTQAFSTSNQIDIIQADALKFDFSQLASESKKLRIIGNLPYNISTELLFRLLKQIQVIHDMHFMLQKEVVERICAPVNHTNYSRLSVMIQYHCQTQALFNVPPTAFNPPPQVNSAIIRLIPHAKLPFPAKDFTLFSEIVRRAFNQRRKTLRKSLAGLISAEQLTEIDIAPQARPQELSCEQFANISNLLTKSQ